MYCEDAKLAGLMRRVCRKAKGDDVVFLAVLLKLG